MQAFNRFVDHKQATTLLQQVLSDFSEGSLQITDCKIIHAHYHTSAKDWHKSRLSICYQLHGIDTARQIRWTQLLYGRAWLNGGSMADFMQARKAIMVTPSVGPPLLHIPKHDITLWGFPNDPQLPHLPLVVDPEKVKPYLVAGQVLPVVWAANPSSIQVTAEILHYYPEERCTLRYDLRNRANEQSEGITLIGKTFADQSGEQIYRRLHEAWQQSISQPGRFRVAQPLAYVAEIKTIWMRHAAGTPLLKKINTTNAEQLLSAVARGLVDLQRSRFSDTKALTVDEQMAELQRKMQKLSAALPELADALQSMSASLRHDAHSFGQSTVQLMHGDFHIRQLLVEQNEIIFLDFDEFALGDPLQDVANFIVDLHYEGFALPFVHAMTRLSIEAYAREADWPVPTERLQWHIRYQFLTRAYRFYRQHRLSLSEDVQQALSFAQELRNIDVFSAGLQDTSML